MRIFRRSVVNEIRHMQLPFQYAWYDSWSGNGGDYNRY